MTLKREQMGRLSRLLDEALPLDEAGRRHWLQNLPSEHQELTESLRAALFPEPARPDPLSTLPKIITGQDPQSAARGLEGVRVGSYRVLSLLGYGGMGSVWLAERADGLFARQVALKLIHPALKSRVMSERFTREREILASLNHPNIARLLDAGFAEDGQSYLALDYVAGAPLTIYCDERRVAIRERLELFRQVLSAVQYAHAHLVIHRDLKPANILVTEEGQVQLLDFGIAKLLTEGEAKETELTQLGGRALTPDYAAPEQIAGMPVTIAADVYALGVMLYELLTGERPYKLKRDSRGALEEAILKTDPVAPSRAALSETAAAARTTTAKKLSSTLRGDLDTIAVKALKKAPTERYATVNAFGEDIERFLRGDVVLAQPDSAAYRALKFTRRHWVGIAAAGVVLLTLAGGLVATSYEAKVASLQRDAALQAQLRSLTQTAAARLKDADTPGALGIILEVLPHRGEKRQYTPQALSVFQEARAADAQFLVMTGHTDRVRSVAFSPDGRRIVTASFDNTAGVWDVSTGRLVTLIRGHTDRVISAAFSPDGDRIVTGSFDRTARIWDTATGREIIRLSGHTDRVRCAVFSPDGQSVATGSYDKTVRIWDAATGREIRRLLGHDEVVTAVAFSPDGRRIVTASFDKTARIWDAATGRQMQLLSGHADSVTFAAFSPEGSRIVTASADKTARIWDAETGRESTRLSGHTEVLAGVAFSPDGQRVVTASYDKTARIWDATTGQPITVLSGHTGYVESAVFSPDGRRVATGSSDYTARIWDAGNGRELEVLTGHDGVVGSAAYSPDGRRIVTASYDKTARIWDAATGRQMQLLSGHTDRVVFAEFSPDGRQLLTASLDKTARMWDPATGRQIALFGGHTDLVLTAAFSPDGRRVVTASNDKTARIWDAATGRQMQLLSGHTDSVTFAVFSPEGSRIVTASGDKTARVWDARTGQQLIVLGGHAGWVVSAAFSPDGRRIVTASEDKTTRIWDAATREQILLLRGHTDAVNYAAFSPDGGRVATASNDGTARIWDAVTGQPLLVLRHANKLVNLAFSPDGRRVVTASDDHTARIWDAMAPPLEVQIGWSRAAQFDPIPSAERYELGLSAPPDVRQWPADRSNCDESAAAPYDPDRRAPGVMLGQIVGDIAVRACAIQVNRSGNRARSAYQHGRALMAVGRFPEARRDFENAAAQSVRAAQIDLGMLLSQPSASMLDLPRTISLYEHAWKQGVAIAAFELGSLYEHGASRSGSNTEYLLAPDNVRAWFWYQKAAAAGEPNALARFAERDDGTAPSMEDPMKKKSVWLSSFKFYAAAAERARIEDWPDTAWRNWRYRRASLARLLAREGMEQEVAEAYETVLGQYAPPRSRPSLTSFVASD
jgi:WD40 repeat protein/tRNA A-37 threonylcarbamoyl transferase component Bud32